MLLDIVNSDWQKVLLQLYIVFICWVIVIKAVAIDHWFGMQKSINYQIKKDIEEGRTPKKRKEYAHSNGFRRSGLKLAQYLAVMMFMFFLDVLNPFWYYINIQTLPIFTILACAVWVWTEHKSVKENFEDKVRSDFHENSKDLLATVKTFRQEMKSVLSDVAEMKESSDRLKQNKDD